MQTNRPLLLLTIALLCSVEFLQTGMVAFASAPIRGEIESSPEEYSLVAALYACMAVVSISKQRWLTERFGWRNYLLTSIAIFIVGALICSTSTGLNQFTTGRMVMAIGGGGFMTSARVLVNLLPPGPGRFTGIKAFAVGLACGTSLAPAISAWMVAYSTWQALFWILIALITFVAFICARILPDDRHPTDESRTQSSLPRILFLGLSSFSILYVLQRTYYDFYNDTTILVVFMVLSVIALYSFFWAEKRHPAPLLKIHHVLSRRYVYGIALYCFSYLILGANNYVLPTFMQSALGYSWETVGHYQSLGLAGTLVTWLLMAKVIPRYPAPKKFFAFGFLSLISYGFLLSSITPDAQMVSNIVPALFLNGCFVMALLATAALQTFREVAHDDQLFTNAQQIKNMFGQIATAAGTALATLFMQWRETVQYSVLNVRLVADDPVYLHHTQTMTHYFSAFRDSATAAHMALAHTAQLISQQATLLASIDYFSVVAVVGVIALIYSLCQQVFRT